LYHQTDEKNLGAIKHQGILMSKAEGIEGPRGIYADPKGFYGSTATTPTVEFHVPKAQWDAPFVRADRIDPTSIIGVHHPWHSLARSLEGNKGASQAILEGKRDHLLNDPTYGKAIRFIKHKLGGQQPPQAHDEFIESEHPRGQPDNPGQFVKGAGGAKSAAKAPAAERAVAVPVPTPASKNTSRVIRSAAFVSSNVAEHLDFGAASSGLKSARHKLLRTLSEEVDDALGMHSTSRGIIGAWADGAEDSVITEADGVDWETLKASVAMKASLADQKAALIFQDAEEGVAGPEGSAPAHLMSFEATGSLEEIHQNLLADGVDFHSIVPHEGGATVYNVDLDGSRQASMEKAAERYGTTPNVQYGHAQFIGNTDNSGDGDQAQRHEAQLAYARLLKGSGVDGVEAIWKRIRPTYGQAFEVSEYPKEETTTPLPGNHGHPALISSRRPTAVGAVEGDEYRRIDMTAMKQDDRVYTENMNLMKNDLAYPNFRPEEVEGKTPAEIERAAINLAKANLRFLYDHAPASVREHGPDWYEGAHNFAVAKAKEYGIPLQSVVAVYAALSPQNLWEANVRQGDAVLISISIIRIPRGRLR
jgi:hypothetical protein